MTVATAEDLFIDELKDIYSAERQAVRAFPRFIKAVRSQELRDAIQEHLEQTNQQLERLDRVFEILEKRAGGKTCEGMKGLLEEAFKHKEEIDKGFVLDAALIGALQRVEHYEIAAYGTIATLAEAMGQTEIHDLLSTTLQEEKETDKRLTEVSSGVNDEAIADQDGAEDNEEDEEPRSSKASVRNSAARKMPHRAK